MIRDYENTEALEESRSEKCLHSAWAGNSGFPLSVDQKNKLSQGKDSVSN